MTYCLAMKLNEGLVFCSDSRTNAGPDRVSTYSKLHRFSLPNDRQVVILTAGNLATTQAVISQIERDLQTDAAFNLSKADYISDIADYIGELSVKTQQKYSEAGPSAGFNALATFIVGGQIKGQNQELYLIYAEGNHITTSDQFPFLQIGETKYGKPILDRIVRQDTPHETAMRCALVSMDSTMRSNATVGPPIELLFLKKDELKESSHRIFEDNDGYLVGLRRSWDENICEAFNELPALDS
jgi:putative proteasome-type protease